MSSNVLKKVKNQDEEDSPEHPVPPTRRGMLLPLTVTLLLLAVAGLSVIGYQRLNNLSARLAQMQTPVDVYGSADFKIGEKGYQRIDGAGGTFFLSVQEARKDETGYSVRLVIGNPQQAAFHGGAFRWRIGTASTSPSQEVNFNDVLLPGTWTTIDFHLPTSKANEVTQFSIVDFRTPRVSLQRPAAKQPGR